MHGPTTTGCSPSSKAARPELRSHFTYDDAHRRESLTLPNGIVLSYAYDNASRITGMSWMLGTNQAGNLEFSYDADGHVIEKTGSLASTGIPAPVTGNTFNAADFHGSVSVQLLSRLRGNAMGRNVLTLEEVATLLKLQRATIYRMLREGRIPAFRIGRIWRFNREEIEHLQRRRPGRPKGT